jgi:hypothetical protein
MISFVTVGVKVMETVVMHGFAGGIGWMGEREIVFAILLEWIVCC